MKIKTRQELIAKYVEFFKSHGHKEIPSASLIPENDPTVLFTSAGMQPLKQYFLGEKHPLGKRLVNVQKCIRTDDIDEVGDEFHHTFFEMLGNWSLGDAEVRGTSDTSKSKNGGDGLKGYFKKDAIKFTFEFFTKVLGLEVEKIGVTCFGGDERVSSIPKDYKSAEVWQSLGISEKRIQFLEGGVFESKKNWWGPAGKTGPCGPDTEIFYWNSDEKAPEKFDVNDSRWIEIGNDVFIQYNRILKKAILVDAIGCLLDEKMNLNKELAEELMKTGARIIVVTNADKNQVKLKLEHDFEVFSLNKNPEKTNSEYFKKLLHYYNLGSDEVIYFDHFIENIRAAEICGIASKLYSDNKKAREFIFNNLYIYEPLKEKNVDFGGGVERVLAILNDTSDDYQTSVFSSIIEEIERISGKKYFLNGDSIHPPSPARPPHEFARADAEISSEFNEGSLRSSNDTQVNNRKNKFSSTENFHPSSEIKKAFRIIADHLRAAVFILGDERGVKPGNVGQGYVLRRLIRRAIRYGRILGIEENFCSRLGKVILSSYDDYDELQRNKKIILNELEEEENKFRKTLEKGFKILQEEIKTSLGKGKSNYMRSGKNLFSGKTAFLLYQSYGFPIEMTSEILNEQGIEVNMNEFETETRKHQELSRTASAGVFKSGLADDSEKTTRLHTATHLLNEALRSVLKDENVRQKGSNITPERLRFDFSFSRKLTQEEIEEVEWLVNEKIREGLEVMREEMTLKDAFASGAQGEFGMKYPDVVSVYTIRDKKEKRGWFSKEICTGPHVKNTKEIGKFKIVKEESVSAGVRRIKGIVE